jgi:hypothetical protein
MAGVIKNFFKSEVLAVVRFLQTEGMSRRLVSVYGQKILSRKEMSLWCNKSNDDSEW